MPLRTVAVLLAVAMQFVGPPLTFAQTLPDVPPLPRQERLVERLDLTATLRVDTPEVVAGARPQLTLVLTNRGRTQLRVQDAVVNFTTSVRAFDSSGNEMHPRINAIIDGVWLPISVRKLPVLATGGSREFSLNSHAANMPDALPTGDYVFRATHVNRSGSPLVPYDVRERGADEVWEGYLTASVAIRVRPVDVASEERLIRLVGSGDRASAVEAIRILGLSRAAAAVDAIVERFERDSSTAPDVLESLGYIGTPHAARALAAALTRMREDLRVRGLLLQPMVSFDARRLLRGAGCDGLALGSLLPFTQAFVDVVPRVCPDVADRLRAEMLSRTQGQALTGADGARQAWALSLLKTLETPPPPPSPTPTVWPSNTFLPPPSAERLPAYVAAIIGFPGGHPEQVQAELSGITRFGTHETFRQLRTALTDAEGDAAYVIDEALRALTFEDQASGPQERAEKAAHWDRWWEQHRRQSREQWAREAIAKHTEFSNFLREPTGAPRAAEYLVVLNRRRYERTLITHSSWRVRVGAALTLAANDPRYVAALLLREIENRYVSACYNAGHHLASLTGTWFPFECSRPEERKAAAAHWTREALALP